MWIYIECACCLETNIEGLVHFQANIKKIKSSHFSVSFCSCASCYAHSEHPKLTCNQKLSLPICLPLVFNWHTHRNTYPHFCLSHFSSGLCYSIDWTRPSIAFKFSYMSEEELWSMNRGTSKDFLLMLSFPGHWRRSAIISSLLPLAISLCSEVRGLCRHTNAEPPRHLSKSR